MVVTPKPGGGIRITADLTKLNGQVLRTVHTARTPIDVVSNRTKGAKYFTTLDAHQGYWQVELDEASRDLTTFITPYGRFRYRRSAMGFISAGDAFNLRTDLALDGLQQVEKIVDDVLVQDVELAEHVDRVRSVLDRCRRHRITLNPSKFQFAQNRVKFAGYVVSEDSIEADPGKVKGVAQFPQPTNVTELRSFIGLVNQLAPFSSEISKTATPLRDLLRARNDFIWTETHTQAFENVKRALSSPPVLATFDPKLPTRLETDASRLNGLGYVLLQQHGEHWRPIMYGSRFLTDTESRYASIELETIAIKYAVDKCRLYLSGLPHFIVITDHRPLVTIFNKYGVNDVENQKIAKIKATLQSNYQFTVEWVKGSNHRIADALSRSPVDDPDDNDSKDEREHRMTTRFACGVMAFGFSDDVKEPSEEVVDESKVDLIVDDIRAAAREDANYVELVRAVENGFANLDRAGPLVQQCKAMRDDLTTDDGLVLFGRRIIIPKSRRSETLKRLHASHQGVTRTRQRAQSAVFWPGISNDIAQVVNQCDECQKKLPSLPKEPLMSDPVPTYPFEQVSCDLFAIGRQHFLAYADRLTGYPMVWQWSHDPSSKEVIRACRNAFASTGVPRKFRSDGGPQFASAAFRAFLSRWGVHWAPSTPYYPASNGHGEVNVKILKGLLSKIPHPDIDSEEFIEGLIEVRNTPRADGQSPCQALFGRNIRSRVPTHHTAFDSRWQERSMNEDGRRAAISQKAKDYYDKTARELKPFALGTKVRIQNPSSKLWDRTGTVVGVGRHRDYHVKVPSVRGFRRS